MEPLALRGRRRRPDATALIDEAHQAQAVPPHPGVRAHAHRRGHGGREGLPPHFEGGAARPPAGTASTTRRRTGSSDVPTSRPASSGTSTTSATRRRSPRRPPAGRRGTWCRADRKWVRDVAVATMLVDVLTAPRPADPAIPSRVSTGIDRRVDRRSETRSEWCRAALHRPEWSYSMDVESRDSVSLKPAELDELGQLVRVSVCRCRTNSSTVTSSSSRWSPSQHEDDELHGFLFGSLERIGGTPCILWGLGRDPEGPNRPAEPRGPRRPSCTAGRRSRSPTRTCSWPGGSRTPPRTRCSPASTTCARARSTRPTARSGPGVGGSPAASAATPATTTAASGSAAAPVAELGARRPAREGRREGRRRAGRRGSTPPSGEARHRLRLGHGRGPRRRPRDPPQQVARAHHATGVNEAPTTRCDAGSQGLRRAGRGASPGSVTGSRHAKCSHTYAVGVPSTSVRPASSGVRSAPVPGAAVHVHRRRDQPRS